MLRAQEAELIFSFRHQGHAWQEGIFEFLSKVLSSWPRGARHAWCCMLANPQNLNIGSMLQSPKTSPFALALQASRYAPCLSTTGYHELIDTANMRSTLGSLNPQLGR